jgi:hypothetical protein
MSQLKLRPASLFSKVSDQSADGLAPISCLPPLVPSDRFRHNLIISD